MHAIRKIQRNMHKLNILAQVQPMFICIYLFSGVVRNKSAKETKRIRLLLKFNNRSVAVITTDCCSNCLKFQPKTKQCARTSFGFGFMHSQTTANTVITVVIIIIETATATAASLAKTKSSSRLFRTPHSYHYNRSYGMPQFQQTNVRMKRKYVNSTKNNFLHQSHMYVHIARVLQTLHTLTHTQIHQSASGK